MKRTILAGLVAGTVAFMWGGLSWSLLPFQTGKIKTMPNEVAIAEFLAKTLPGEGVYQYPGDPDPASGDAGLQEAMQRYERGPVVPLLVYKPGPGSMNLAAFVARGLGANLLAGVLLAMVLALMAPAYDAYWSRVGVVGLIATFATLITHVPYWAWGSFPTSYTLIVVIDAILAWLVAGMVLVRLLRPAGVPAVATRSLATA